MEFEAPTSPYRSKKKFASTFEVLDSEPILPEMDFLREPALGSFSDSSEDPLKDKAAPATDQEALTDTIGHTLNEIRS